MDEHTAHIEGYNLQIIAPSAQEGQVRQAMSGQTLEIVATGSQAQVQAIRSHASGDVLPIQPVLVGRSEPGEYQIEGAPWGSQPDAAYAPSYAGVQEGSQVEVTLRDGSARTLTVAGTYDVAWSIAQLPPPTGLLAPESLVASLAKPDTLLVFIRTPAGHLHSTSETLGRALPGSMVIDLQAYADRYAMQEHNLFVLAVAMAGLALLAGVLLVANSVSLAMLDRRYEIGVLKAVGYSRHHLLVALGVEYGLVALIATTAGLAAVQVFFMVLSLLNQLAGSLLFLSPQAALWIVLLGLGLPLLAMLAVAWGPTRASPTVVLNERV
jgi:putative ABC transport system permease protein